MSNHAESLVAVVTGGSRGVGRGIARALGSKGATVYVTGRPRASSNLTSLALDEAAAEITACGGRGIALRCDHSDDEQVAETFAYIAQQSEYIDILVNNAAAIHQAELMLPGGFWEKPLKIADIFDVGLRSNYIASYHSVPLMLERRRGLIVNISFYGAVSYNYAAAYGGVKAGIDKLARDMAIDLKPHDIASVSIWPGYVLTDELRQIPPSMLPPEFAANLENFESPEFTGHVIDALYHDKDRMTFSGKVLVAAELAKHYGIADNDGKQPPSYRDGLGAPHAAFEIPI